MQYFIFFYTGSHICDGGYEIYAASTPEGIAEANRRVCACAHNDYLNFEQISDALAKAIGISAINLDGIVHGGFVVPEIDCCFSFGDFEKGGDENAVTA